MSEAAATIITDVIVRTEDSPLRPLLLLPQPLNQAVETVAEELQVAMVLCLRGRNYIFAGKVFVSDKGTTGHGWNTLECL